jgi:hypothetical protein
MRYKHQLKQILVATRSVWDRPETRDAVRHNFDKMVKCGTLALGAEIFSSGAEEKVVPHTCKARPCPSCGHRATLLWQREQWCALPDVKYAGIVFTMPSEFWPIFQQNRHLLHDLPNLAAAVIQQWVKLRYGVRVLIMVIPHTFGSLLNFNSHLHMLVSKGGIEESEGRWVDNITFDKAKLMRMWRFAVVTFLREALEARVLSSDLPSCDLRTLIADQYRWWSVHIDHFTSKEHFLRYAGRYVRRPPIAQYRIERITEREVHFRCKQKKHGKKRWVTIRCPIGEFVAMLAQHVPDRYRHAIRCFGLLAPRTKARTSAALFTILKQRRRPRPRRLSWAFSIQRDFGVDPLSDSEGRPMRWAGRLNPVATEH